MTKRLIQSSALLLSSVLGSSAYAALTSQGNQLKLNTNKVVDEYARETKDIHYAAFANSAASTQWETTFKDDFKNGETSYDTSALTGPRVYGLNAIIDRTYDSANVAASPRAYHPIKAEDVCRQNENTCGQYQNCKDGSGNFLLSGMCKDVMDSCGFTTTTTVSSSNTYTYVYAYTRNGTANPPTYLSGSGVLVAYLYTPKNTSTSGTASGYVNFSGLYNCVNHALQNYGNGRTLSFTDSGNGESGALRGRVDFSLGYSATTLTARAWISGNTGIDESGNYLKFTVNNSLTGWTKFVVGSSATDLVNFQYNDAWATNKVQVKTFLPYLSGTFATVQGTAWSPNKFKLEGAGLEVNANFLVDATLLAQVTTQRVSGCHPNANSTTCDKPLRLYFGSNTWGEWTNPFSGVDMALNRITKANGQSAYNSLTSVWNVLFDGCYRSGSTANWTCG